jgi:4-hydroxy-2-oxoheptanedioate aldolase
VRDRVVAGRHQVGIFVQTPHPIVVEVVAAAGVDCLCIDQEHAPIGVESLHALVGVSTVPALVRVPDCTPHAISAALDAGAAGVLVPRVSTAAQAADAVAFARYPPAGSRGLGPGRAAGYGREIDRELVGANDRTLLAIQIETGAAVAELDEILEVDGVDLVFVGPGDLGASLGRKGPDLEAAVTDVLARARAAGRATGMFAPDAAAATAWLERGVSLVLLGSDLALLAAAVADVWRALPDRASPS